jgi:transposase
MYQHEYTLRCNPVQLLDKYNRWRKRANLIGLSDKAKLRLEWIIFYYTQGQRATYTAKHFGLARSKFYFWLKRFDDTNLKDLEDNSSTPTTKRAWSPDPVVLERMLRLRRLFIHWGKKKLATIYEREYGEKIASWQFQRMIEEFKLYPMKKKKKCSGNGASKQLISYAIRQNSSNLFSLDTKVLHLFGKKHYVLVALGHDSKIAYMRAYSSHGSMASTDFLARLEYLLGAKPEIILTDNGSEWQKHFEKACQTRNITRYYSRIRTPKDNPEVERMIKTFIEEWLVDGHWSPNLHQFNQYITDFLIIYNDVRPHEKLNNLTPLQYAEQNGLLSKTLSSCTLV